MVSQDATVSRRRSGPAPADRPAGLWPPPRDAWLPACGVALIFAAHLLYGALVSDTALAMDTAAAVLLGVILLHPRLRNELTRLKGLAVPGALLALVIGVALWTLTPFTPGGPHPVWTYVGLPGASTIDKSTTLVEILKLMGLACLFLVGAATGARDERARFAVQLTLVAGGIFGLWAFVVSVGRRLEAHFLNPNTAGTVFAVLLILCVAELLRQLRSRSPESRASNVLPLAGGALTFATCMLASASRGAVMALLGASLVFMILQLTTGALKLSRALAATLGGLLLLIGLVALAGDRLVDRAFHSNIDAVVRSSIWQIHWKAFLDSPLFGYGLGNFEPVNKSLLSVSNFDLLWNVRAALNVYLQWLEEAGLVGAIPMFLCIGIVVLLTVRGTLRRSRMTSLLAGLLAADSVFLLHGATDFALQTPSVAAFWAWLLGLQFSLAQGSSRR